MITLNEWCVWPTGGVAGVRETDNKEMRTSPVATLKDGVITTQSGSQYQLGEAASKDEMRKLVLHVLER